MNKKSDGKKKNLRKLSPEDQKLHMENWFRDNYENPVEQSTGTYLEVLMTPMKC